MATTVPEARTRSRGNRAGVALFIVIMFVVAIALLAITAIATTGNAVLVARSYARENDLRYAAEAALAIGKSRLNYDADALPDTGYVTLLSEAQLKAANGQNIPGVKVTVYAGPSGSSSGQFGRFASVVAEARDNNGNGFIRRLELTQESFAKYAYWSNRESNNGSTIYFGGGDQLWGPVWSNDVIHIQTTGATFNDDVATAKTISGAAYGTFRKGYKQNQKAIALPATADLQTRLSGFAQVAGFKFTAPASTGTGNIRMRIEFIAFDMNADGDSTDADEGFFRVYEDTSGNAAWLRGDFPESDYNNFPDASNATRCGDWHPVTNGGPGRFFPASVHSTTWARDLWRAGGMSNSSSTTHQSASFNTIMGGSGARCYLGGAPQLVATARNSAAFTNAQKQIGGSDQTFYQNDRYGRYLQFTATPHATVATRRAAVGDANYLFPLHRSINLNAKGVIYVTGRVGVSGVLRGRVTLFATNDIVILDDTRYANDPGGTNGIAKGCLDMLGILASNDIVVADNVLNTPRKSANSTWRNMDDTKDLYIHGVVMALNTAFTVENYNAGPTNVNDCEGTNNGRGCLYLAGGLIQDERGAVGTSGGTGFTKRYSYDRCAIVNPPPYFPTTGRFTDNRYYELNPVGFSAAALYQSITPSP